MREKKEDDGCLLECKQNSKEEAKKLFHTSTFQTIIQRKKEKRRTNLTPLNNQKNFFEKFSTAQKKLNLSEQFNVSAIKLSDE